MPIFVYELFEIMQSSVTESRTFATKSLSVSFKQCKRLLIYSKLQQNTKFQHIKFRGSFNAILWPTIGTSAFTSIPG